MRQWASAVEHEGIRRLTKHEIDRRIEQLVSVVTELCDNGAREDGDLLRPRWIAAGELVRRVRPFIVLN